MRRIVPLVLTPFALLLVACGAQGPNAGGAATTADEPPPAVSEPDPGQLYEANATVLESKTHGPMLCLGVVLASLPPQCGDVPLAGWDWRAVGGEEEAGGTTWGMYGVVGRYDGETFTVTQVGPYEDDPSRFGTDPDTSTPCPEPAGGWTGLDHATQNDVGAAAAYARSQPDYVALWVTHLRPAELEFGPVVVNAVFTGDVERHEAEIRKLWAGPLCVVARDVPSERELAGIRKEAEASLDELGLRMLWSSGPDVEPVIEIGVVADPDGKGQAAFDARYGPGVVRVIPALEPVS
jgi:hypothetical protein